MQTIEIRYEWEMEQTERLRAENAARSEYVHTAQECAKCGGAPDGMCPIDVGHLADVYSVHTLGQLRTYLRETAAEGTVWYKRSGDAEIILYYPGCVGCGPAVPPAEYREIRITGGKQ